MISWRRGFWTVVAGAILSLVASDSWARNCVSPGPISQDTGLQWASCVGSLHTVHVTSPGLLDAGGSEDEVQDVVRLGGRQQNPQWYVRGQRLGGEAGGKMTDARH